MSAELVLRDAAVPGSADSNLQLRWENTLNEPLDSVTWRGDGRAIADTYEIEMLSDSSCKVTCNVKNVNAYTSSESVTTDGSTVHSDLIPGCDIVFDSAATTGQKAKVSIGQLMSDVGVVSDRLAFGVINAGTTTSPGVRVAVTNIGGDPAQGCVATALPGTYFTGAGSTTRVLRIDNHSADSRDKMAVIGTYTITFTNWADGTGDDVGYKVCDIVVAGPSGNGTAVSGARFDGSTVYEFGHADYDDTNDYLKGLQIVLAYVTSDPTSDSITLQVTDGYLWLELAPDVSGSEGTYGTSDVTLTEVGETTGTITAGGTAYFWARVAMPDSAVIGLMKAVNLKVRGLTT